MSGTTVTPYELRLGEVLFRWYADVVLSHLTENLSDFMCYSWRSVTKRLRCAGDELASHQRGGERIAILSTSSCCRTWRIKALSNEETLLRKYCLPKCFPVCAHTQHWKRNLKCCWMFPETFRFLGKCFFVCEARKQNILFASCAFAHPRNISENNVSPLAGT